MVERHGTSVFSGGQLIAALYARRHQSSPIVSATFDQALSSCVEEDLAGLSAKPVAHDAGCLAVGHHLRGERGRNEDVARRRWFGGKAKVISKMSVSTI